MLTICGPSQCGKTFWIYNLLSHLDKMIVPQIDKIVYLYTSYQPLYDKMKKIIAKKIIEFIDCNKGIPRAADIQSNLSDNTLVVLDDLMTVASSSKENITNLDNFASRNSHHSNISIIFKNIGDRRNMYVV